MKDLTLVIPAKNESDSLPQVLEELKNFDCKIFVVLEQSDKATIDSIKNYNCEIIFQGTKGYGDALICGINKVETKFLCIFNADGSFNPKYLNQMRDNCEDLDFIFASRYLKGAGSDDDTFLTKVGNFIFTSLGKIFFSLKISDILFTYVLGKTNCFKSLNLKCKDFCLCVEIPINAKKKNYIFTDVPNYERRRIAGIKKVNEFKDGFKILIYMIKRLFN